MPQQFLNLYDQEKIELPPNFYAEHPFDNGELDVRDERLARHPREREEVKRHLAEYYAMISHLDYEIGRILDALRATGRFENTIIVLSGDNGLALGSHGLMGKQNNYDHSVHVPLVMMGPGIPQGVSKETYCYLIDIFPTLCGMCGLEIPGSVEGRSLMPVLSGDQDSIRDSLAFAYRGVQRSVMGSRYKLIEYVVEGGRHTQLFDMHSDPYELNNLADLPGYEAKIEALRGLLLEWRDELADPYEEFWQGF
jgi:arylsulfatase A-like enzyme